MARCKDCLHYEACYAFSKIINSAREVEKGCEYFKNRTKYVEVVRCKDCINQMGDGACCVIDEGGADDFFCSYGERRNNEPEKPV